MKQRIPAISAAFLLTLIVPALTAQTIQREVKRGNEKEVSVSLTSSFGSVNLAKGASDKVVTVRYRERDKETEPGLQLDYSVDRGIGDLRIELHPEHTTVEKNGSKEFNVHVNGADFRPDEWYVALTDAVPLSIDAELGAGKSDFNLSGLIVKELSISTGASKSMLSFNERNKGEIDELRIETGVSKFSASGLNNANYRSLSFDGGVGSYHLDFGGELDRTVDVTINVGLGAVTLVIPEKTGVRVKYEDSWLSNFTIDDEFVRRKKGVYESENYASAKGRMNVFIESGLGSVKVRRSR